MTEQSQNQLVDNLREVAEQQRACGLGTAAQVVDTAAAEIERLASIAAGFDAAVEAARAEGAHAVQARFSAALGGFRHSPPQLGAALDMLVRCPDMSGEVIAQFVSDHVKPPDPAETAASDYASRRAAAAVSLVYSRPEPEGQEK